MMADPGISVTHTTILRWVRRYVPEFEKRWWRYARPVGGSSRMDETYVKVQGRWVYLYRAGDKAGQTIGFVLSQNRDVNATKSFLRSPLKNTRVPTKAAGEGPLQPALEQPGGAGPSENEATNPAHAGIQTIRQRGGSDFRDRLGEEDQKRTIRDGQAGRPKKRRCRSCGTPHSLHEPIAGRSAKRRAIDLLVGLSLHQ
jgi:hypothetical protein